MTSIKKIGFAFLTFLFLGWETFAQCPMCKAAVESQEGSSTHNYIVEGLNHGIIYLFALPYTAFLIIGTMWFIKYRKQQKLEASLGE